MICEICGMEFENFNRLSIHLSRTHKNTSKEYYDKYLKKENDGICLICGKKTKFENFKYKIYCSSECSNKSEDKKEKRKKTNIEKYGFENPFQNEEIKEKIKITNIEKYGVDNPSKNKEIQKRKKDTNLEKYGVEYTLQNKEIKEKGIQTNIEKYGTKYSSQNKEIKNKIKKTNIEKYGVEYITQNKEIKNKIKKTILNNLYPKINKLLEYLNLELLSDYNQNKELIEIRCKTCGIIFQTQFFNLQRDCGKCPVCFPKYKSNGEIELLEFIKSLNLEIIENSREIISPKELDIYIPSKNIAIEFNGLYYHSEEHGKDKLYHLNKTESCESKNIQLIHIFEDEWLFKQEIVKSRLKQILGLNNILSKIHARKCEIIEIPPEIKNEFLEKYHIQGKDNSNIKLGAFYDGELIAIMTFSKSNISRSFKSIEYIWELSRFCSNYNYHIIGIASKLLSYFKKNYEWREIFSYADRRWSTGNVYKKIGFELEHTTKPNYWYTKNRYERIHRFSLRKRPDEPKDIPEWILRLREGYSRIWDCGHYKFKIINEGKINE